MIKYYCDLCGDECNNKLFDIPIAATFIKGKPCDLIPIEMNLCHECRSRIYKTIEKMVTDNKLKKLNKLALDIKMNR